MKPSRWTLAAYLCFFYVLPTASSAENLLDKLSVVALAPLEERAIVKSADGALHVVGQGDLLPGTTATVLQVLPDKLVLTEQDGGEPERGNDLVWLYKRQQAGGGSRVQRLQRTPPPATGLNSVQPSVAPAQR